MLLAPRNKVGGLAIDVTAVFAGIEVVGWTAAALEYPHGPRDNDVWDFLRFSGTHPWIVVAVCAGAAALIWAAWRMRFRSLSC